MLLLGFHQSQSTPFLVVFRATGKLIQVFIGRVGCQFTSTGRTRQTVQILPHYHLPLMRMSMSTMPMPIIKGMVHLSLARTGLANAVRWGHGMTRLGLVQCAVVLLHLTMHQSNPKSIMKSKTMNCPAQRVVPHHQARFPRWIPKSQLQATFQLTISPRSQRIYLLTCSALVKRHELVGSTDIVQAALAGPESSKGKTSQMQRQQRRQPTLR